jgi:hypothetical protein
MLITQAQIQTMTAELKRHAGGEEITVEVKADGFIVFGSNKAIERITEAYLPFRKIIAAGFSNEKGKYFFRIEASYLGGK